MYAVIFKARAGQLDQEYLATAAQLRQLALSRYGCTRFDSLSDGEREIAISYWDSLEAIEAWKAEATHQAAQQKGRKAWYRSYEVEVVEILRSYAAGESQA